MPLDCDVAQPKHPAVHAHAAARAASGAAVPVSDFLQQHDFELLMILMLASKRLPSMMLMT